jgi:hypothetical protein
MNCLSFVFHFNPSAMVPFKYPAPTPKGVQGLERHLRTYQHIFAQKDLFQADQKSFRRFKFFPFQHFQNPIPLLSVHLLPLYKILGISSSYFGFFCSYSRLPFSRAYKALFQLISVRLTLFGPPETFQKLSVRRVAVFLSLFVKHQKFFVRRTESTPCVAIYLILEFPVSPLAQTKS